MSELNQPAQPMAQPAVAQPSNQVAQPTQQFAQQAPQQFVQQPAAVQPAQAAPTMLNATFAKRNAKSLRQLIISENSAFDIVKNPKKPGHSFFMCGTIRAGYISPRAMTFINQHLNESSVLYDGLQYAETSRNGGPYVPTLMVVGNSRQNITHEFGSDLLHD